MCLGFLEACSDVLIMFLNKVFVATRCGPCISNQSDSSLKQGRREAAGASRAARLTMATFFSIQIYQGT